MRNRQELAALLLPAGSLLFVAALVHAQWAYLDFVFSLWRWDWVSTALAILAAVLMVGALLLGDF